MRAVAVLALAGLRGRRRSGLVVVFGVLLLSAVGLCTGLVVADQGTSKLDEVAAEANVADVVVWAADGEGAELGPDLAAVPGVTGVAGPVTTASADLDDAETSVPVDVTALDDPDVTVNRPQLTAGRWLGAETDLVLEHSLADDLGIAPGDTVQLAGFAATRSFTVVGTATDLTDCAFPDCDPGRMFATSAALADLGGQQVTQYWLDVAAEPGAEAVAADVARRFGERVRGTNTWLDTRGDLLTSNRVFGGFVAAFGGFLLAACAVVVAGSMTARMVERRRELALLAAVGFRPAQISAALVAEHVAIGLAAGVSGWAVASGLAPYLQIGGKNVPGRPAASWSVTDLAVTVAVLSVVLVAASLITAVRAARVPVTEGLADVPGGPGAPLFGRAAQLPRRLGLLGVAATVSRPVRSALTALAVVVAVTGAVVAFGFVNTMENGISRPERTGDPWDALVVLADETDKAAAAQVEQVLASSPEVAGWYTEADRKTSFAGETYLVRAIGGNPPGYELGAGRLPVPGAGEVAVGYGLVHNASLDVGSVVSAEIAGRPVTATVTGWYRTTEDTGEIFLLPMADLLALEPDAVVERYRVTSAGPSAESLAATLSDRLGRAADVQPQDSELTGLDTMRTGIYLIAGILALVAVSHLAASLLTSTREGARATGVQAALGRTPRQLVSQGAIGAAVVAAVALAVAVPLGLVVSDLLGNIVSSSIGIGPGFGSQPGWPTLVALGVGTLVVCAALGAWAASRLTRAPVAGLLRYE